MSSPSVKKRTKGKSFHHVGDKRTVWDELKELHNSCLSHVAAVSNIGVLLKNKILINQVSDKDTVTRLATELVTKLQTFVARLDEGKDVKAEREREWRNFDVARRRHRRKGEIAEAEDAEASQDAIAFTAIQYGEAYQRWLTDWSNEVTPTFVIIMGHISEAQEKLRKNANEQK